MRIFRIIKILGVVRRFGVDEMILEYEPSGRLSAFSRILHFGQRNTAPRAERLRLALESLGPIFVKFGQVLSTRRDLLPLDIADELAKLQDRVQPFSIETVHQQIENAYGRPTREVFAEFSDVPEASASVAQVHFARLHAKDGGHCVAVKILRPDIHDVIKHDLSLMQTMAWLLEKLWADGRRLKPQDVVTEFAKYLNDELDLMREAANCSQLRRNFADSKLLLVPEVYWDFCTANVMVMERMQGISISQREAIQAAGISLTDLSRAGVEIFFTQVLRDGFFHADMHPGNIYVAIDETHRGKYIALDFGIVGILNEVDKNYLAQNFLAFFRRDYHRVAMMHIEAGWVPPDTRVEEFEAAIRAVCEPIFDKPLCDISFGKVLIQLFQTSRRFHMEVQPQLLMLQKTLLNVEGVGRQLDPTLDLWAVARPFLERWMKEQLGWRALMRGIVQEIPSWAHTMPHLPRLVHQSLSSKKHTETGQILNQLLGAQRRQNRLLTLLILCIIALITWLGTHHL